MGDESQGLAGTKRKQPSPATPIRPPDKRHSRRFLVQVPARFLVGDEPDPLPGALVDLSLGGAFVILYKVMPIDGRARMTFGYGGVQCRARGFVIRYVPLARAIGLGVVFTGCDQAFVSTLRNWGREQFVHPGRLAQLRDVRVSLRATSA